MGRAAKTIAHRELANEDRVYQTLGPPSLPAYLPCAWWHHGRSRWIDIKSFTPLLPIARRPQCLNFGAKGWHKSGVILLRRRPGCLHVRARVSRARLIFMRKNMRTDASVVCTGRSFESVS